MPEQALRRLADDAERSVELPGFTDLVHRARRRRRRRHALIGAGAAGGAALIATALLLPGSSGDRAVPPVTNPTPIPSLHHLVRHSAALVNQPDAQVMSVSYAGRDKAAALWQVCSVPTPQGTCPQVVTWTTDRWRTSRAATVRGKVTVYDLPDGSVLAWMSDSGVRLDGQGHRHPVTRSAAAVAARPGGRYVDLPAGTFGEGPAGMLDLRTDTVHRPLAGPATECLSDARWGGATLWELGTTRCALHPRQSVAWTGDLGRTWSARTEHHPVLSVQVAPHRTAILVGGPTGQLRFLDVTDDAGASWHRVVLPQPIIGPNAYATTPDGHLFVAAGSHVYASTSSWTSFHPVAVPGAVGALDITAADGVISVVSAGSDRIAESYDDGQTWHQVSPRPGPTS